MIYLILSILMSVVIANMLKYFQQRHIPILYIFLANYFTATLLSYFLYPFSFARVKVFDYTTGIIVGVLYLLNFIVFNRNIRKNGMSLSVAVMRVSLLIPILLSLLLLGEQVMIVNYLGIALIIITFSLLGRIKGRSGILLLAVLFVMTGISDFGMKFYEHYGQNTINTYLFFLFLSAFVCNIVFIIIRKERFSYTAILFGLLLGIPNQLTSYFFMKALFTMDGAIAYPMLGAGVTIASIITDRFIWKSPISKRQILILLLLIIGIVLINIRAVP